MRELLVVVAVLAVGCDSTDPSEVVDAEIPVDAAPPDSAPLVDFSVVGGGTQAPHPWCLVLDPAAFGVSVLEVPASQYMLRSGERCPSDADGNCLCASVLGSTLEAHYFVFCDPSSQTILFPTCD